MPNSMVYSINVTLSNASSSECRRLKLLQGQPISIGRASQSHSKKMIAALDNAYFDSAVISRSHAQLTMNSWATPTPQVNIKDLDSRHGTFVNGEKLSPLIGRRLCSGDRIKFGAPITVGNESHDGVTLIFGIDGTHSIVESTMTSLPTSRGFRAPSYDDSFEDIDIESEDITSDSDSDVLGDTPTISIDGPSLDKALTARMQEHYEAIRDEAEHSIAAIEPQQPSTVDTGPVSTPKFSSLDVEPVSKSIDVVEEDNEDISPSSRRPNTVLETPVTDNRHFRLPNLKAFHEIVGQMVGSKHRLSNTATSSPNLDWDHLPSETPNTILPSASELQQSGSLVSFPSYQSPERYSSIVKHHYDPVRSSTVTTGSESQGSQESKSDMPLKSPPEQANPQTPVKLFKVLQCPVSNSRPDGKTGEKGVEQLNAARPLTDVSSIEAQAQHGTYTASRSLIPSSPGSARDNAERSAIAEQEANRQSAVHKKISITSLVDQVSTPVRDVKSNAVPLPRDEQPISSGSSLGKRKLDELEASQTGSDTGSKHTKKRRSAVQHQAEAGGLQMVKGALLGAVGGAFCTIMFLASPAAESLVNWLEA